jgi:hypothetical protein
MQQLRYLFGSRLCCRTGFPNREYSMLSVCRFGAGFFSIEGFRLFCQFAASLVFSPPKRVPVFHHEGENSMTKRMLKANSSAVCQAAIFGGLVLALGLLLGGCENPADGNGGSSVRERADDFKAAQSAVLEKTVDTVTPGDEAAVDAALAAFESLSDKAQALLGAEKEKLDALKAKITELKAANPVIVNILDLSGLIVAPSTGTAPDTASLDETQYTGAIAWQTEDGSAFEGAAFAAGTVYQAVISLTAKNGYTFAGVGENSFSFSGATTTSNAADSGTVTVLFPATTAAMVVNALDLTALLATPVTGGTPVRTPIDEEQYTGAITWLYIDMVDSRIVEFLEAQFAPRTTYIADVTLTPKTGYTFTGVTGNDFTHSEASTVTNFADSGTVQILFRSTASLIVSNLDLTALATAPVKDATPDTTPIDTAQYTGTIAWRHSTDDGETWTPFSGASFEAGTVYRASLTLSSKAELGYDFTGLTKDDFTYTGATVVSLYPLLQNSRVYVAIEFPATEP